MKRYSAIIGALSILLCLAFTQCNSPTNSEVVDVTTQIDTTILVQDTLDSKVIVRAERDNTTSISTLPAKLKKDIQIKNTDNPKIVVIEKSKETITEKPKTTTIDKAKPVKDEKPIVLESVDFSLKSVKATIKGTSTLRDWESKVTIMEGKGSFQLKDDELIAIKDVEIKISVKGIISEEGSKMDDKTYETFNSDKYPYIVYSFSKAVVKVNSIQGVTIETIGNLTMAGTSKTVSLVAHGQQLANGDLQLTVTKTIKMTDYNMEPPVMFLGTIKVGNEITVSFDLVLVKNKK
jgi:polyisoprenoid-binding protein YceI